MSKSQARVAARPAARPTLIALAMGLSVAAVALTPHAAYAGGKNDNKGSNGNSGNNGNGNGNGNAGSPGNSGGPTVITLPDCAPGNITPGAAACSGFFQGNLLSNSPADVAAQATALTAIGLSAWNGTIVEPQLNLTSSIVDFLTALNGVTWIGVHFGAGTNSPSPQTPGGVTAFYRFDAGTNLDTFTLNFGSASAARLYATGPAPTLPPVTTPVDDPVDTQPVGVVPEPAAWALMILGFGAAGAMLRRRRGMAAA